MRLLDRSSSNRAGTQMTPPRAVSVQQDTPSSADVIVMDELNRSTGNLKVRF